MSLVAMQTPSHRVTEKGDRVTVHGLELFVGHIDGFDDDDSEIKDLDSDAIDEIVKMTQRHMSAGSNPKLVPSVTLFRCTPSQSLFIVPRMKNTRGLASWVMSK